MGWPLADTALAAGAAVLGARTISDLRDDDEDSAMGNGVVLGTAVLTAALASSAIYGYVKVGRCSEPPRTYGARR